MNVFKSMVEILIVTLCFSSLIVKAQNVNWDFENGNDDGFTLWSVIPATPASDDPNTAGDESITGVGGDLGLPFAGIAWTIGPPIQFDGQKPAVMDPNNGDKCHLNADSQSRNLGISEELLVRRSVPNIRQTKIYGGN